MGDTWGEFIESVTASKGIAGAGPDLPPDFHVITTVKFKDMDALHAAFAAAVR